jgi:hypothetical protein
MAEDLEGDDVVVSRFVRLLLVLRWCEPRDERQEACVAQQKLRARVGALEDGESQYDACSTVFASADFQRRLIEAYLAHCRGCAAARLARI